VLGLGGGALALILTASPEIPLSRVAFDPTARAEAAESRAEWLWPALFGEIPPEPVAATETAAPEPSPDFSLKGLVAGGEGGWAIVSADSGDHLVSVGSVLPGGAKVIEIQPDGVRISLDDKEFLIGFDEEAEAPMVAAELAPAPAVQSASLSLSALRDDGFQRSLGLAGGSKIVDQGNGNLAQQIMWVRNGRLYDKVGLRKGDIILTLNGVPAGDIDALRQAAPELLRQRDFELELLRAGARMTLKVQIDEDS